MAAELVARFNRLNEDDQEFLIWWHDTINRLGDDFRLDVIKMRGKRLQVTAVSRKMLRAAEPESYSCTKPKVRLPA